MRTLLKMLPLSLLVSTLAVAQNSSYFQPNSTGVKLQNGFERVFVQPFGNHAFRVRASLMHDPSGTEPSALLDPPLEGPGGQAGLDISSTIPYAGNATIRNGDLVAEFNLGVLSFYRVEPNGTRTLLTAEYTDDKALPARYYVQEFRSSSFEAQFSFLSDTGEGIYGAGQQACCRDESVNKKGSTVDLLNFNSQVPIPMFMSDKGYLMFFNFPGQGRMEFGHYKTRFVAEEATVIDYYITTASPGDYDTLQEQYTAVTGRQPTPPDFILGFQQSKLRYYNQSQVIDVAQRFHDEQINLSMIVVDFFAWKFQGDWSFDPSLFPDPAGMAAQVKNLTGAEMMVSLWPSVENLSRNYLALQKNGWLVTTRDGTGVTDQFAGVYTRLVDSTNPGAREFLWKTLNDSYFSKGIHNFWIDQADGGTLGEPFENNGDLITQIPYARSFAQYFVGTQTSAGKLYPWLHQAAINEGLHNLTEQPLTSSSCEYMSLTRSTFAGGQRYCSYLWSGDTESKFEVLLQQITAGVSVSASGISSWTLDIGGFEGLNVDSEEGRELFVRWLAMGTFLPYMRVHGDRSCNIPANASIFNGNNCPNEPWSYGEDNFPIIKMYIALRYQLVPYVKALFQKLYDTGRTIMRPLYYDFSLSDEFVVNATKANDPLVTHQFMLGPRILVSPVGVQGATSKIVYLPRLNDEQMAQNFSWTHWWSGKDFGQGGISVDISAPLDQIPVFFLGSKDDIMSGDI
ncbi:glycoside hydrolase family 31 protein [Stereum hirsutum FP-91666 SS1]|uniref:glycoside hydrolase family 31 protein n=1 Tax=Stereum hirsutum (strain FP-91666) TaxID=721885 RepID=UPI000440BB2E|nr:glycoside hydrolase family 31 protein [Stereum hirsutum FP-91666 SS1]EIM87213.1 glycoside hydrolase family 31 protein [Stereum hirsutum FP-91666 SS1]